MLLRAKENVKRLNFDVKYEEVLAKRGVPASKRQLQSWCVCVCGSQEFCLREARKETLGL